MESCQAGIQALVGLPQSSIMGPVLFKIFINNFARHKAIQSLPVIAVDSLRGWEALQRDLDKLQSWAVTNPMKLTKTSA